MQRRDFLGGSVVLAVTAMLPQGVASAGTISSGEASQCWVALRRLRELDQHGGASTVYPLAAEMATRLRTALQRGTVAPSAEPELRRVMAATTFQTGWFAYDAGQQDAARRWWLETCHLADLAEIPEAHVATLATMALQASTDPARCGNGGAGPGGSRCCR